MASQPYIGEIRIFAGSFAPRNWAMCNGQTMAISQNETLYNLIGTTYGGDGQTTFELPDLRGRVPVGAGQGVGLSNYVLGQKSGSESVILTQQQIPTHNHTAYAAGMGTTDSPANEYPATDPAGNVAQFKSGTSQNASMNANAIATAGGGQPHNNLQPVLPVTYIIALFGVYPSRS